MIRVEAIKKFTLKDFDKLKNISRKAVNEKGKLFVGDEFECDDVMFEYLTGNNPNEDVVVKLIEIIPEQKKESKKVEIVFDNVENKSIEIKPEIVEALKKVTKPKTTKKKKTSKK